MSQAIFNPVFQSIGYAILHSIWQFSILWLLYLLVTTFINLNSKTKYSLAIFLKIIGLTWVVFTVFYSINQPVLSVNLSIFLISNTFSNLIEKLSIYIPYLTLVYFAVVIFLIIRLFVSLFKIQTFKLVGISQIPFHWSLFTKNVANQLCINSEVKIYLSNLIKSPLTIGFLKPIILIPIASINQLTVDQLEAIIVHELAHIKRADFFINILVSIIDVLLFFNPFNYLLSKSLEQERENACDDLVLQNNYNQVSYAEALLNLASQQSLNLSIQAASKNGLLIRVKRILGLPNESTSIFKKSVSSIVVLIFILVTSFFSTSEKIIESNHNNVIQLRLNEKKLNTPINNKKQVIENRKAKELVVSKNTITKSDRLFQEKISVDEFISNYNKVISLQNYLLEQQEIKNRIQPYQLYNIANATTINSDTLKNELIEVVIKAPTINIDSVKIKRRIIIL